MAGEFFKDYDTLLQEILTDYNNLDEAPDTSVGSITFIKAACLASAVWGLYKYQDYLARQIFPDTSDSNNLDHHGSVLGLLRQSNESDSDYLARILEFLRKPPAGGNKVDYANWTKFYSDGSKIQTITNLDSDNNGYYVGTVQVYPNAQAIGTVDVVIVPTSVNSQIITTDGINELHTLVFNNIDELRPVTSNLFYLYEPTPKPTDFFVLVTGPAGISLDLTAIQKDIINYISTLAPGDTLYKSKIISICSQRGALDVTLTPDTDFSAAHNPGNYEIITPGVIPVVQNFSV